MGNPALIKNIKSQSMLEVSFILIAGILFLLGVFRIGLWYNNELAERQPAYTDSRVEAGSDTVGMWPIYARRPLTGEWVLEGHEFPPEGTFNSDGGSPGRKRDTECEEKAEEKEGQAAQNYKDAYYLRKDADDLDAEAVEDDKTADYWKKEYDTCFSNCKSGCWDYWCTDEYCESSCSYYKEQEGWYRGEAERKRRLAGQKRIEADDLEDEADALFAEAALDRQDCWKPE